MGKFSIMFEFEARDMLEAASNAYDGCEHLSSWCKSRNITGFSYGLPIEQSIPMVSHGEQRVVDDTFLGAKLVPVANLDTPFFISFASFDKPKEPSPDCTCRMGAESLEHAISCPCNPNYGQYMAGFPLVVTHHESMEDGKTMVIPAAEGNE